MIINVHVLWSNKIFSDSDSSHNHIFLHIQNEEALIIRDRAVGWKRFESWKMMGWDLFVLHIYTITSSHTSKWKLEVEQQLEQDLIFKINWDKPALY